MLTEDGEGNTTELIRLTGVDSEIFEVDATMAGLYSERIGVFQYTQSASDDRGEEVILLNDIFVLSSNCSGERGREDRQAGDSAGVEVDES